MSFRPILATACIELIFFQRHLLSVTQILEYQTHSETFGFHHINSTISNNAGSMHKYFQTFYTIRNSTRCTISSDDRARHRYDAPILLRDIMASSTSFLEYLVSVSSMHGRQDIQYQRVKTYIFILSHLGGFNKRV